MKATIKDTKCKSWAEVNWTKANKIVNNLQRRIFVAINKGVSGYYGNYKTYYFTHNQTNSSLKTSQLD